MTISQAKSELMRIYMSLSEEKKKALDVAFKAMEQAEDIPVMYYPQVDGITPTVVAQADGEINKRHRAYLRGFADAVEQIMGVKADGEYIPKSVVLDLMQMKYSAKELYMAIYDMKGVAIPNKTGHWIETGRMFVELNDDQILYECICDKCKGLAYFRKSMDDLVGAKYCPCCNSPMEIER